LIGISFTVVRGDDMFCAAWMPKCMVCVLY
jgi:hypothetical protein